MQPVSVIMVSYFTGPVLFEAIACVLAQTLPVELILVDNGNPVAVVEKLRTMAADDPRIRLITGHGNIGFGSACNRGARAAEGDQLLFLNPDSKLQPDTLARLLKHSEKLKRPFMIGARLLNEKGEDQRGCRRALLTPLTAFVEAFHLGFLFPRMRLNFNHEPLPEELSTVPAISGAFMFIAYDDFRLIKGFDEDYFLHVEDLDLCLTFRRAGGEIYFAPDIVATHIGGTSNAPSAFIEKWKARGFIRYFHKNFAHSPLLLRWVLGGSIWVRAWGRLFLGRFKVI